MLQIVLLILTILILIWLSILSFYFRKLFINYLTFTRGGNKKTLDVMLSDMSKDMQDTKSTLVNLIKRYDTMEQENRLHIQRIGLLRFNPFKDTGGEQSFILSLVDARNTGIVITALYSRSGTRWYAKRVLKGKGVEHELSEEEKKALEVVKA